MRRTRSLSGFALQVILLLSLGGCTRPDPLDRVVKADTFQEYHHWIYRHRSALDDRSARELTEALDQLKLRVQIKQAGLPPNEIARRALDQIHDLTVREILTQSHLWRHRYLAEQNAADDRMAELNANFPITPDADDTIVGRFRHKLEAIRRRQRDRLSEMQQIESRLHELNPQADLQRLLSSDDARDSFPERPQPITH
jgi:hypothetical protein